MCGWCQSERQGGKTAERQDWNREPGVSAADFRLPARWNTAATRDVVAAMKTANLLLLLLALPPVLAAQAAPPPFTTRGAFFALSVPDLDASTRWYQEKLGLAVTLQVSRGEGPAAATVLEGGGLIVELIQHRDAKPAAGESHLVHGFFKAGMIVENLDATLAELRSRGVEVAYGPYPAEGGQRANVIVRDNAGNLIQLFGR